MQKHISVFSILLLWALFTSAQSLFTITQLDGTAKAQRSLKKNWESVYLSEEINDNDIIETYFQTKLVLQYGVDNSVILGSNTRCLLNIKERTDGENKIAEVNITLFSGGVLVKVATKSSVRIYTANAVAQIDSGTISTVVEAKTGHTGLQLLGGSSQVRNVAQQQGKSLTPGLTTIVLPGKEPTAPLYMTYRHVAVLKHFFGDEFIDQQINEAGITPTEDVSSVSRLSLSQSMQNRGETESQVQKRLFSENKIWGTILDDQLKKIKVFEPIKKPSRPSNAKGELEFISPTALAGGELYPKFALIPSFYFPNFSFGLNLPLAKNADGALSMHFGSAAGVFDKIHHLTIGRSQDSSFFKLGTIGDYTVARGLIVNKYHNRNTYAVTQPLGITARFKNELFDASAFISDVTNWQVGGVHLGFFPGNAWLGGGYYFDVNQYRGTLSAKTSRFIDVAPFTNASVHLPDPDSVESSSHIYEVNFGASHRSDDNIAFDIIFQFAGKIAPAGSGGLLIRGPEFGMQLDNFNFGISYVAERGKLIEGYFSSMYMSNRLRVESIINDTLIYSTQNNALSGDRHSYGFVLFFRVKPVKGTFIDFAFRQDFLTREPFASDSTLKKNNFNYTLALIMNDKLFAPIKYAEIYLNQVHGGFYPQGGRYFGSWGFNAGFDLMTAPLFLNMAFKAGLNFGYIDLFNESSDFGALNDNIDRGDYLLEFFLGLNWGFM